MNLSMCLVGFKVWGFSRNSSKQQIGTGLACCTSWLNCMCVCSLYLLKLHLLFFVLLLLVSDGRPGQGLFVVASVWLVCCLAMDKCVFLQWCVV